MAKTAKKFWNQEEAVIKKRTVTYICCLCEKVKSQSLTRAFFGHWHEDPDAPGEMIVVCHHCQGDDG